MFGKVFGQSFLARCYIRGLQKCFGGIAMKRILMITLLTALIVAGCDDGNVNKKSDNQSFSGIRTGAYSDQGFYAIDEDNCLVYFIDKNSYKSTPLCDKTNCAHDDSSCNAFYGELQGVYVNDGFVYVTAYDYNAEGEIDCMGLYKLTMDGSEKNRVRTLFRCDDDEQRALSADFIIHRGVGYLTVDCLPRDKEEWEQIVWRVSLEDDGMDEIYRVKGYYPSISIVSTYEDNIYFCSYVHKDSSWDSDEEEIVHCYNSKDESVTDIPVSGNQTFETCCAGKMYFMECDRDMEKLEFFVSDMDGKNNKSVYKMENVSTWGKFCDGRYRYIEIFDYDTSDYRMVVLDYDGREICDFHMGDKRIMWSDGENILFQDDDSGQFSIFNIDTLKETVIEGTQ